MSYVLLGATPLPELMLDYCLFDHWEEMSMNLNQNTPIFVRRYISKIHSENDGSFGSASVCKGSREKQLTRLQNRFNN